CDDGTGSGCAATHFTTDGTPPTRASARFTGPLALTGTTTLRFFSVDVAGNDGPAVTETYDVDAVAPTVSASPRGGTYFTPQTVTLTCADAGSGCAAIHYTVNGETPNTTSPRYTGALTLAANTALAFLSVDAAGNPSPVVTETYTFSSDPLQPQSTITPAAGTYFSAQAVTLACEDGSSGSGCAGTFYTLDGSEPSTSSQRYTGPFTVSASGEVRYRSIDVAGNLEVTRIATYAISLHPASAQIGAVRAATDGAVSLPIQGAVITYVKPGVGNLTNDPAGFFLQADREGPALFVEADPATLTPRPQAGMRVAVTVTNKRRQNNMVRANISGFSVQDSGIPLTPFVQDVSRVDVPFDKEQYEAELLSLTGTVDAAFIAAGVGHVQAALVTEGVRRGSLSSVDYRLRMVESVREQLDVTQGCTVGLRSPLWVFGTTAQPSAWTPEQVTSLGCPGPRVAGARPASAGTVIVRFDRRLNPGSVLADGSQFTIPGLTVTGATVAAEREVRVSTSTQTPRQSYTVSVASTVRDPVGTGVEAAGNSFTFRGYAAPAVLRINEVAPAISGGTFGRDLVELYVVQGGNTDGMTLVEATLANPLLATLPDVDVATGDLIVIHLDPDRVTPGSDAPASEVTSKTAYPQSQYLSNYDTAWDFHGAAGGVTNNNRVFRIRDPVGNTQDAVPFVFTLFQNPPAGFLTHLSAIQMEGQWLPANCNGGPCNYNNFPGALDVSVDWTSAFPSGEKTTTVRRVLAGDSNRKGDWAVGTGSLGLPNP
ncbi:chitobiase/beta-hexosaminidase C-terminal domain-containing protein, partial [Pyxidicoccus sp. 3LFB2]